jgi:hypothetical protein
MRSIFIKWRSGESLENLGSLGAKALSLENIYNLLKISYQLM